MVTLQMCSCYTKMFAGKNADSARGYKASTYCEDAMVTDQR